MTTHYNVTLTKPQLVTLFDAIERAIDAVEYHAQYEAPEEAESLLRQSAEFLKLAQMLEAAKEVQQ